MRFELFVATRYLRAKRRQAFIGIITGISILGVAAGVASLIVALAVNNGFRQDLQARLLGSTAHISLLRVESDGMRDWRPLLEKLSKQPHVVAAAPAIYEQVLISRGPRARGAVLKGMLPQYERKVSDLLNSVTAGSAAALEETSGGAGSSTRLGRGRAPSPHRQPRTLQIARRSCRRAAARCGDASDHSWQGHGRRNRRDRRVGGAGDFSAGRTDSVWHGAQVHSLSRGGNLQLRLLRLRFFLGLHPPFRRAAVVWPGRRNLGHPIQA